MTLLFMDGFEDYASAITTPSKKWTAANVNGVGTTYGRFGGRGVYLQTSAHYLRKTLGLGNKTQMVFGIAFRYNSANAPSYSSGDPLITFKDEASAVQVRLHTNSGFGFTVYNGAGTLLGSSANSLFSSYRWYYIEMKAVISDTVGSVEVHLDESTIINLTNQDTKYGTNYIETIEFKPVYSSFNTYVDDAYIDDANFLGNSQIKRFLPDSDGNSSDFTRSTGSNDYECVDEAQSNEDTDYIYSDTLNHKSLFGITTGALGTIGGIQVNLDCRIDEAGTRKITPIVRSNSVDYSGSEGDALSSEFKYETGIWETDPDDSNAWTQTKLEAAEFGLEITT